MYCPVCLEGVRVKLTVPFLSSPFPKLSDAMSSQDLLNSQTQARDSQRIPAWIKLISFGCWIWLALTFPALAKVLLRVSIAEQVPSITVGSSTPARILDRQGNPLADIQGMAPIEAAHSGQAVQLGTAIDSRLYLQPLTPDGLVFIADSWYRGLVELIPSQGGLVAVNQVGLDDYVSSVIGSEMGHRFPPEALKAQAVASRTYALYHRNQRLDEYFDVGNDQQWQVYKGVAAESNLTQAAARDTADQVLTHQNQIINAVFHSSSGGHTEDVANVWVEPLPYLKGVPDYDSNAPVFSWTKRLTTNELSRSIGGVGSVTRVDVVERTPYGRAKTVQVVGTEGSKSLSASQFRQALRLRSTMFSISAAGLDSTTTASLVPITGTPSQFVVNGRGFGHGIGMSQWGASSLASEGWSYQQILFHYYQGTGLATLQTQ